MRCPVCRIASMDKVRSGDKTIDRCMTCGALWFDYGEIRELTEGRLSVVGRPPGEGRPEEDETSGPESAAAEEAASPSVRPAAKKEGAAPVARLFAEAKRLECPRCSGSFLPVDFQTTGIVLFACRECRGLLAPRAAAAAVEARFRFLRDHEAQFAALGETLAEAERKRVEDRLGAGPAWLGMRRGGVPLPVVVPLGDDAPALKTFPIAAYGIVAVLVVLHLLRWVSGAPPELPGGLAGLPSGMGFSGVPKAALLAAPFLHAGVFPLTVSGLFLFVLGDNVEERVGSEAFVLLFLLSGAAAGTVHVLWGGVGEPAALGSAGAVAGVLGAYLVFFPDVSVKMFGMGRVVSIPAYLFGCAWVVATFLLGRDALLVLLDSAPYAFAANLAGLCTGALFALAWRWFEQPA